MEVTLYYIFFCILVVMAVLLLSLKQEIRILKKRVDGYFEEAEKYHTQLNDVIKDIEQRVKDNA